LAANIQPVPTLDNKNETRRFLRQLRTYIDANDFWTRTGTLLNPETSTDDVEWDKFKYLDATTGGANNLFIGDTGNTANSGDDNVFAGTSAGFSNTTGYDNFFLGKNSGINNTTGFKNTAIGRSALNGNISGSSNIGIGQTALNLYTGSNCIGIGATSLNVNVSGNACVGIGTEALRYTTGPYQTAVGHNALRDNVDIANVAVGYRAMLTNTGGSRCVALGYEAGRNSSSADSCIFIGFQAGRTSTRDNTLIIENSSDITTPLIYGEFDNDVLTFNASVEITKAVRTSAVETITASSDTLDDSNYDVLCDCSSNAITINLPAASGNTGLEYLVTKVDSSGNAVTIDPNGSETINGVTTAIITAQYTSLTLRCDGSNWGIRG
jgi:hypothetical protein